VPPIRCLKQKGSFLRIKDIPRKEIDFHKKELSYAVHTTILSESTLSNAQKPTQPASSAI